MGQASSQEFNELVPLKQECDVTRMFPKSQFIDCSKNDALFSYSVPLDASKIEHVLVSKTSHLYQVLQNVANLARFGRCYNFIRYEKSFFCESPKAMTKLHCKKFGGPAYFTVVSNYQSCKLNSSLTFEEFIQVFFQLCYALRELDDHGIYTTSVDAKDIGLKLNRIAIYVLESEKIYSFENTWFPVYLNFKGPSKRLTEKFWDLLDTCNGISFQDDSIKKFIKSISTLQDVFTYPDLQKYQGVKVMNFPSSYYLDERVLPEPMLKPYFAVSKRCRKSVAQISNRLLDEWVKDVDQTLDDIQTNPTSYNQLMIYEIEHRIRTLGHPNLIDILTKLSNIETKTRVSPEHTKIYRIVRKIERLVYHPKYEGERLLSLEFIVRLFDYVRKKKDPILTDAATSFIDIYLLGKLSKDISKVENETLERSKLVYIKKIYSKIESNPYVPKELVRLLREAREPTPGNYPEYGKEEWKRIQTPKIITKTEDESEPSKITSALLTYLSVVRVGEAFDLPQKAERGTSSGVSFRPPPGEKIVTSSTSIPSAPPTVKVTSLVEQAKRLRDSQFRQQSSLPISWAREPKFSVKKASVQDYVNLGRPKDYKNPNIVMFTSYTGHTKSRLAASRLVAANQRAYADQNGYTYRVYEENLAKDGETVLEPYWSKIAGINKILNDQEPSIKEKPEWIIWMDDDAIISNPDYRFEDVIDYYTSQQDDLNFIVTTDSMSHTMANVPLNSAVLIIRNNDWSREFFKDVWDMRNAEVPGRSYTYGTCPNQSCLHEQQAITELLKRTKYEEHSKIIDQRDVNDPVGGWGINTFKRHTHYDVERKTKLTYEDDQFESRPKDFIQQCTGLASKGTSGDSFKPTNLRKACIEEVIDEVKHNFPDFYAKEKEYEEIEEKSDLRKEYEKAIQNLAPEDGHRLLEHVIDLVTPDNLEVKILNSEVSVKGDRITLSYEIEVEQGEAQLQIEYDRYQVSFSGVRTGLDYFDLEMYALENDLAFSRKNDIINKVVEDQSDMNKAFTEFKNLCEYSPSKTPMKIIQSFYTPQQADKVLKVLIRHKDSHPKELEVFVNKLYNMVISDVKFVGPYVRTLISDDSLYVQDKMYMFDTVWSTLTRMEHKIPENLVPDLVKLSENLLNGDSYLGVIGSGIMNTLIQNGIGLDEISTSLASGPQTSRKLYLRNNLPDWYKLKSDVTSFAKRFF